MTVDLDEAERLCEAATEAPWWDDSDEMLFVRSHPKRHVVSKNLDEWDKSDIADIKLIAWCRTGVPALCRELRLAREVVKYARSVRAPLDDNGEIPWWTYELRKALRAYESLASSKAGGPDDRP